jgi:hypothetical protein
MLPVLRRLAVAGHIHINRVVRCSLRLAMTKKVNSSLDDLAPRIRLDLQGVEQLIVSLPTSELAAYCVLDRSRPPPGRLMHGQNHLRFR